MLTFWTARVAPNAFPESCAVGSGGMPPGSGSESLLRLRMAAKMLTELASQRELSKLAGDGLDCIMQRCRDAG